MFGLFSQRNLFLKFKGSIQFPLAGSQTKEFFDKTTIYTGDFKNPTNRTMIFAQPRLYKITVVLAHNNGIEVDECDYSVDTPLDHETLTQIIKELVHEQIADAGSLEIDLEKSYVRIELG